MNKRLLTIFLSVFYISLFAQNIEFKKENFPDRAKDLKKAVNELKEGDYIFYEEHHYYEEALKHYKIAQDFNPNNAELNYKIGVCYLSTLYKTKSLTYFIKAYELNPSVSENILLLTGRSYHLNEKWDDAIKFYNKRIQQVNSSPRLAKENSQHTRDLKKYIEECENGKVLSAKPVNVKLENLGGKINTKFPEYLVIVNADESVMMFTSQRPGSTGENSKEFHDDYMFHHEDIYVSHRKEDAWDEAYNVGPPVNTEINDATIALAPDGHTVLTYNDKLGSGDIYQCNLEGDKWSIPKLLSSNINSPHHESSASFSYDGKSLYFVSDNPEDNYGDHDIYVSHWDENTNDWGKAINLGDKINTPFSEQGVFAHPDGKSLYFSSKGHNTMGGFDIFKATWDEASKSWSQPVNMGYPINGPGNDVGLVISASGLHGYVAAYHSDSYGKEDIYMITFPEDKIEHLTILKGYVTDCKTKQAIKADIEILDIKEHKEIAHFESNSKNGHYLVSLPAGKNYAIEIDNEEYLFHSENFDLPEADEYHEIRKDICLAKIEVGKKIVLNNVFFDSREATLRPESIDELNKVYQFMIDNPSLRIEFSGHTDNIGSDAYNQDLSDRRATSVVNYLIEKGVESSRMTHVGYGEKQPIDTNETPEGRQNNRRTELKIIGS